MKAEALSAQCRNCDQPASPDDLDRFRWCEACLRELLRRSAWSARGIAVVVTLGLALWIALAVGPSQRFLVAWMAILAAIYFFVSRLSRRIAFDVIRGIGVPRPKGAP